MATSIISEKELRIWATDLPALNTLVDGVRWSPEDIEQAIINTVDKFNTIMPPTGMIYTPESFPSRSLLATGVWGWLLKGAAVGEASNNLQYSATGVQINDRDKAQVFMEMGNDFWKEFIESAKELKLSQNISRASYFQ